MLTLFGNASQFDCGSFFEKNHSQVAESLRLHAQYTPSRSVDTAKFSCTDENGNTQFCFVHKGYEARVFESSFVPAFYGLGTDGQTFQYINKSGQLDYGHGFVSNGAGDKYKMRIGENRLEMKGDILADSSGYHREEGFGLYIDGVNFSEKSRFFDNSRRLKLWCEEYQ